MGKIISSIFDFLAVGFDKIPLLNKFKGYRSVLGFVGLGVTAFLATKGVISNDLAGYLNTGFMTFSALALNSKGRE